jgi:hypothetical protein
MVRRSAARRSPSTAARSPSVQKRGRYRTCRENCSGHNVRLLWPRRAPKNRTMSTATTPVCTGHDVVRPTDGAGAHGPVRSPANAPPGDRPTVPPPCQRQLQALPRRRLRGRNYTSALGPSRSHSRPSGSGPSPSVSLAWPRWWSAMSCSLPLNSLLVAKVALSTGGRQQQGGTRDVRCEALVLVVAPQNRY